MRKVNWKISVATLGFCFVIAPAGAALAQQCGDVTDDGKVAASDALAVLNAAVGRPVELICTDSCAVLEERVAALEALLDHVSVVGNNLRITGQNLQVVSGAGATYSPTNGTGNIIIGYNEDDDDDRSGSHNLVIGSFHSYSAAGGAVLGVDNDISGDAATILGGTAHEASGDFAAILGGFRNDARGESSTIAGGEDNRVDGLSGAISGGVENFVDGDVGVVSGGGGNEVNHDGAAISGGSGKQSSAQFQWIGGTPYSGF